MHECSVLMVLWLFGESESCARAVSSQGARWYQRQESSQCIGGHSLHTPELMEILPKGHNGADIFISPAQLYMCVMYVCMNVYVCICLCAVNAVVKQIENVGKKACTSEL